MVLGAIEATGAHVISPEKGNYLETLTSVVKSKLKDEKELHYEAIRKGILLADGVIIEASHEDFQLGTEAAFAVDNKKHILCLSINENFSEKMKKRYFKGAKYNEFNVEEIVDNFVQMVAQNHYSERFNCFLSPSQIHYLKRKSKANNMNSSEYIRKLIDDDRIL